MTTEETLELLVKQSAYHFDHFMEIWEWQTDFEDRIIQIEKELKKQKKIRKTLESIARSLEIIASQKE